MPENLILDSAASMGDTNTAFGAQAASGRIGGGLSIAQALLQNNFNINALRTNATLRKDEWIELDKTVIDIARSRLVGVADLIQKGLVYNLTNALGTTRLEWERQSDMTPATMTMSGISESENDRITYDLQGMPIPIIHKDFNINIRALAASRRSGQPLDMTQARVASRKVAEIIETTLFNGATILGANNPIYGYKTAPNRNTGSLTLNTPLAMTGNDVTTNVLAMISALQNDNMYGPYVLYVSNAVALHFQEDYKANGDSSIMSRVLEIDGLQAIRPTKDLSNTEFVLVQMTSDVVEMVDGMQPTTVEWATHGGMVLHFKVMAIMLPRIRADFENQSGIAHFIYP